MIEIFSAIFRLEGVQIDKAKFQIISILTGTGFTTNESELMLASKRRRKITQIMILFSYIFNISIVSTIVNLFISTNDTSINEFLIGIILTIFNIILLIGLNKSTRIRRVFDNMILKIEKRKKRKKINQISIYDYYGNKVIAEVNIIDLHDKIINLNIEKIKELYDIQILVVKRGSNIISEIDNNFKIQEKDILLVFGNYKNIKRLFRRNTKTYKSKTNKK